MQKSIYPPPTAGICRECGCKFSVNKHNKVVGKRVHGCTSAHWFLEDIKPSVPIKPSCNEYDEDYLLKEIKMSDLNLDRVPDAIAALERVYELSLMNPAPAGSIQRVCSYALAKVKTPKPNGDTSTETDRH
jgi:hypothetical protein